MAIRTEIYGQSGSAIGVVGQPGIDRHGVGKLPHDKYPPGSKHGVTRKEQQRIEKRYDIRVSPQSEFVALTAANFAVAQRKLQGANGREVILFAPLSRTDQTTNQIRKVMSDAGVTLLETPYNGDNSRSLVVPDGHDRTILVAKPDITPPITTFDDQVGFYVLASAGGAWDQTLDAFRPFAANNTIPYGVQGSESQTKQLLTDPQKRKSYLAAVNGAAIYLGNVAEARNVVTAYDRKPKREAKELGIQLQHLGNLPHTYLTFGAKGAVFVDDEQNVHMLRTTPLPRRLTKNPVGAGDGGSAAMVYGGSLGDSIESSMVNAAAQGVRIVQTKDSMSGQMHTRHWHPDAKAEKSQHYEVYSPQDLRKKRTRIT